MIVLLVVRQCNLKIKIAFRLLKMDEIIKGTKNKMEITLKRAGKRVFFKNLDAWRFIAFLGVFLVHGFNTTQSSILDNSVFKLMLSVYQCGRL
jgi:hypothetical protein